jgi:hypothetical protein
MENPNDPNANSDIADRASSREGIMAAMAAFIPDPSKQSTPPPRIEPEPEPISSSPEIEPSEPSITPQSSEVETPVDDPITRQAPKEEPKKAIKKAPIAQPKGKAPTPLPKSAPLANTTPATTPIEPERAFDEEIDSIQAPLGVNPQALKQLRTIAAKYKGEAGQLRPQLAQLQTKVNELTQQTGKIPEPVEKELKELRAHRTLYDVQNDPSFKAAYDDKIDLTANQIYDHLKNLPKPMSDADIESIKKGGGIFNFRTETGELLIDSEWWNNEVRNKMPFSFGSKYDALVKNGLILKDNKEQTIQQIKQNREQFEQEREGYVKKMREDEVNTSLKLIGGIRETIPWAKVQDIPVDATPELRQQIEEDNAFVPELEKRYEEAYQAFNSPNVQKRTELAATYALAHKQAQMLTTGAKVVQRQTEMITQHTAEITRLNAELQKLKNAGKTRNEVAVTTPSATKPKAAPEDEYMNMNTKQALAARLA